MAQGDNPTKGDFVKLVEKDLERMEENLDFTEIQSMTSRDFKKLIKSKTKSTAFKRIKMLQSKHSKIQHIEYDDLRCQSYMTSPIFTNTEVNLLHSLRSRSLDCKVNFRGLYGQDLECSLCEDGAQDDQAHILRCPRLREMMKSNDAAVHNIKYEDIFDKDVKKQKEVTALIEKLLTIKKKLLNKTDDEEEQ